MDVFRAALDSLLNETVTTVQSERYTRMRKAAAALRITYMAENIVSALRGCFTQSYLPNRVMARKSAIGVSLVPYRPTTVALAAVSRRAEPGRLQSHRSAPISELMLEDFLTTT